jgi:squalene-hopene/tetraprenyl-beta-curcumene cyclase
MMHPRLFSAAALFIVSALPALGGDWNKQLAADYLDARQKEWFEWPPSAAPGGPCVSCHTGVTYLLARPVLRRALGEQQATSYETGLLAGLRSRLAQNESMFRGAEGPKAQQAAGVNAIVGALSLTMAEANSPALSPDALKALDHMWSLQIREGPAAGAWHWFDLNLDPWESPEATFYGATLAALAVGNTPASYREQPEVRERIAALAGYLGREQYSQPIHNLLILLWPAAKRTHAVSEPTRQQILSELWRQQQADGGWAIQSLGPWKKRDAAPPSEGSNSYATALAAYTLQQAGTPRSDARLARAVEWLKSRQDSQTCAWPADSMNKKYEPGSIPERFMRDAATAFATLALLEADGR